MSLLSRIAQVEQQTVALPGTQFIDRAVNVPLVTQREGVPTIKQIPKTVEIPHSQFIPAEIQDRFL